jgi:Na+/H+ antiporter NhaC
MEDKSMLYIVAIVAIVAVVALVILSTHKAADSNQNSISSCVNVGMMYESCDGSAACKDAITQKCTTNPEAYVNWYSRCEMENKSMIYIVAIVAVVAVVALVMMGLNKQSINSHTITVQEDVTGQAETAACIKYKNAMIRHYCSESNVYSVDTKDCQDARRINCGGSSSADAEWGEYMDSDKSMLFIVAIVAVVAVVALVMMGLNKQSTDTTGQVTSVVIDCYARNIAENPSCTTDTCHKWQLYKCMRGT